jgi:NADH-quinone oxidoreductase subunit M
MLVGMIYERRHTREIAAFGGIAKPMPVYAALFGITVMSSVGLPLLNGFVGEFLILLGAFKAAPGVTVAATFGVVLAAVYLLWMFRRVFFGPVENPENRGLIDLGLREKAVLVAMIVPMFWIGIYPDTALRRLHPPVLDLLHVMEAKSDALAGPAAARAREKLLTALEAAR